MMDDGASIVVGNNDAGSPDTVATIAVPHELTGALL
jgi:hypothetical protein